MNATSYVLRRSWLLVLLVSTVGCADTYTDLLNEEIALANEFADSLLKVVDEPSAQVVQKKCDRIKKKLKAVKDRKDRFDKGSGIGRIATLGEIVASTTEINAPNEIKAADYTVIYTRIDKENVRVEILCSTNSIVNDMRTLANPDTHKHLKSIRKRVDQQMARIGSLLSRLQAEKPGVDEWPTLASMKAIDVEVLPQPYPPIQPLPIDFKNFNNMVKVKSGS